LVWTSTQQRGLQKTDTDGIMFCSLPTLRENGTRRQRLLALVNVVALRRARLVLGWVTLYLTKPPRPTQPGRYFMCMAQRVLVMVSATAKETRRMAIANGTCVSFCTFWPPWVYAPGTIAVNVTWMERGFNACQTHVPIYLQPFTSYSVILVGNCNFYVPLMHLTPPMGVFPLEFPGNV